MCNVHRQAACLPQWHQSTYAIHLDGARMACRRKITIDVVRQSAARKTLAWASSTFRRKTLKAATAACQKLTSACSARLHRTRRDARARVLRHRIHHGPRCAAREPAVKAALAGPHALTPSEGTRDPSIPAPHGRRGAPDAQRRGVSSSRTRCIRPEDSASDRRGACRVE